MPPSLPWARQRWIRRLSPASEKSRITGGGIWLRLRFSWILGKGTTPIVGMARLERVEDMVGPKGKGLGESDVKYMEELYVPREISGL